MKKRRRSPRRIIAILTEEPLELRFRALKHFSLLHIEGFSSAIDVEVEHRHCRLPRGSFAPRAPLRRMLEGPGNFPRISPREDAALKVEGVASLRHGSRPSAFSLFCLHFLFREALRCRGFMLRHFACALRIFFRAAFLCFAVTIERKN